MPIKIGQGFVRCSLKSAIRDKDFKRVMRYKVLWTILIFSSGLITFLIGMKFPDYIGLLNAVILTATLIVLIWYTVETYKLRTNHEHGVEIESFPWLTGSDLVTKKVETIENFIWNETIYLPIKNTGKTPALNVNLKLNIEVEGPEILEKKEIQGVMIAPGDIFHFKLGQFNYHKPEDKAQVEAVITYKSYLGGEGKLIQKFCYCNKSWVNGPSTYYFTRSDGRSYPINQ